MSYSTKIRGHPCGVIQGRLCDASGERNKGTGMTDESPSFMCFKTFFLLRRNSRARALVWGLANPVRPHRPASGGHIGTYNRGGNAPAFKIYFPRIDETVDYGHPLSKLRRLPRGERKPCWVVEDEPSLRIWPVRYWTHGLSSAVGRERSGWLARGTGAQGIGRSVFVVPMSQAAKGRQK